MTVEAPRPVVRYEPLALVAAYQVLDRLKQIRLDASVLTSGASLGPAILRSLDAIHCQRDASAVSRFESGLYPPRLEDVQALLNLYQVTDAKRRDGLEQPDRSSA